MPLLLPIWDKRALAALRRHADEKVESATRNGRMLSEVLGGHSPLRRLRTLAEHPESARLAKGFGTASLDTPAWFSAYNLPRQRAPPMVLHRRRQGTLPARGYEMRHLAARSGPRPHARPLCFGPQRGAPRSL
eukprot:scaffold1130_cov195-Pinguiococcus_pyrenoidosus.AAC.24